MIRVFAVCIISACSFHGETNKIADIFLATRQSFRACWRKVCGNVPPISLVEGFYCTYA